MDEGAIIWPPDMGVFIRPPVRHTCFSSGGAYHMEETPDGCLIIHSKNLFLHDAIPLADRVILHDAAPNRSLPMGFVQIRRCAFPLLRVSAFSFH